MTNNLDIGVFMSSKIADQEKCTHKAWNINGVNLTTIEMDGRIYFIARDVGLILGYANNGGRLVTKIGQTWSKPTEDGAAELQEGVHYLRLEGERLAEMKRLATGSVGSGDYTKPLIESVIGANAPSLLLLTEPGLWRVLILTGKPAGIRLRDKLDSEILPQLRKTGTYSLPSAPPPPPPQLPRAAPAADADDAPPPAIRHLRRLLMRYQPRIDPAIFDALDLAVAEVEDLRDLSTMPATGACQTEQARKAVGMQITTLCAMHLPPDDLERVLHWIRGRIAQMPMLLPAA